MDPVQFRVAILAADPPGNAFVIAVLPFGGGVWAIAADF